MPPSSAKIKICRPLDKVAYEERVLSDTFTLHTAKQNKRTMTDTDTEERKIALVTGITGQDGSYLAEFLLEKGYTVSGGKFLV